MIPDVKTETSQPTESDALDPNVKALFLILVFLNVLAGGIWFVLSYAAKAKFADRGPSAAVQQPGRTP